MPKYLRARAPHDDSEARKIRRLAGARHAPADWIERARIITLSWDGLGNQPGPGRKRRITEAQRSAIIAMARSLPPGQLARDATGELSAGDERGPAQWTLDTLAQTARDAGIAVGRSQVRRTRSWATSTDPESALKGPGS